MDNSKDSMDEITMRDLAFLVLSLSLFLSLLLISACGLSDGERVIYEVDHYQSACMGESSQACLRVRPEGEENFELMYSSIGGFDHQWGRRYDIEILIEEVDDPPMDASSKSYDLVDIIDERPVEPGETFEFFVDHPPEGNMPFIHMDEEEDKGSILSQRGFRCASAELCSDVRAAIDAEEEFVATFEYDEDIDDRLILNDIS